MHGGGAWFTEKKLFFCRETQKRKSTGKNTHRKERFVSIKKECARRRGGAVGAHRKRGRRIASGFFSYMSARPLWFPGAASGMRRHASRDTRRHTFSMVQIAAKHPRCENCVCGSFLQPVKRPLCCAPMIQSCSILSVRPLFARSPFRRSPALQFLNHPTSKQHFILTPHP